MIFYYQITLFFQNLYRKDVIVGFFILFSWFMKLNIIVTRRKKVERNWGICSPVLCYEKDDNILFDLYHNSMHFRKFCLFNTNWNQHNSKRDYFGTRSLI